MSAPTRRLKAWIQGYPSMLPVMGKKDCSELYQGACTVRVMSVHHDRVRMYSPDLVKTAAGP